MENQTNINTPGGSANTPPFPQKHPNEMPLFILVTLFSISIWVMIAISVIGLIYLPFIALFLIISQAVFIAYIRGSSVKCGPNQFPEYYERVQRIARKFGMLKVPDVYIAEAGGSLNAFATRFFRAPIMVLYSDLIEACEGDEKALDMIIGHELGHIEAGHLSWALFNTPGRMMPLLGQALSRAQEYTCDQYGLFAAGDKEATVRALGLLAAGKNLGKKINKDAFIEQTRDLDTGFMALATWFSTHPPLCQRVAALSPSATSPHISLSRGHARALVGILLSSFLLLAIVGGGFYMIKTFRDFDKVSTGESSSSLLEDEPKEGVDHAPLNTEVHAQILSDLNKLDEVVKKYYQEHGTFPDSETENSLVVMWEAYYPGVEIPLDPFDKQIYGFYGDAETKTAYLWSIGPDKENGTDDDIDYDIDLEKQ